MANYVVPYDLNVSQFIENAAFAFNGSAITTAQFGVSETGNFQYKSFEDKTSFAPALTDANSFLFDLASTIGNQTQSELYLAGKYNELFGGSDKSGLYGNPRRNYYDQMSGVDAAGKYNFSNTLSSAAAQNGLTWTRPATPAPCFLADTPILRPDGTSTPIQHIKAGDEVATFDGDLNLGRGVLQTGTVRRVFGNITREVIGIHYSVAGESHTMYHTPKHVMMTESGKFKEAHI
jgi:hypothetical protein